MTFLLETHYASFFFFQPLAPTEAKQLCDLNIKVSEYNNRKPNVIQFWPYVTNYLSIFVDRHIKERWMSFFCVQNMILLVVAVTLP